MNNEDKPFPCTIGSCKQRFANADHLHVHCMKHEMSLKSLDTPIINLDDTTPTPTRFLKNENTGEDGLFTDLVPSSTNPFDLEFRKASEKRRMSQEANSVQTVPRLDNPDMNQSECDSGLGSEPILESVSETMVGDITSVTSVSVAPSVPALQETVVSNPIPVDDVVEVVPAEGDLQVVETVPPEADAISMSSDSQQYGSQEYESQQYQPPVPAEQPRVSSAIQTQPPVQQIVTHIQPQPLRAPNPQISVQAMAPLQAQASSLNSIVNSLPTNITAPLLIKLPDGQQIRVVPSVVANPSAPVPVAISANQKSAKQGAPKSTAETVNANADGKRAIKERLKETLLSNQSHGNMNVMAKAVEVRMREQQQVVKQEGNSYTVIAGTEKQEDPAPVSGVKRSSEDDDPNVKRQKFLERNRAAAMRCREKKKQWVTNLETKAENLTVTNVKLNNEILKLKNEVAHLKQLLLAHKDCPVTQMQQRQSQNWQVFHAIKETEEEIQSTKSSTAVSVQNSDSSERMQTTVMEVSSTSPEGESVMVTMSQSMREAVRELTPHNNDGGMTTITVGEGGVPTVIIN